MTVPFLWLLERISFITAAVNPPAEKTLLAINAALLMQNGHIIYSRR